MAGGRSHCVDCERPAEEVGGVSIRGLCEECAAERMRVPRRQLQAHAGPAFDRWRAGMIKAAGGVVPQQLQQRL